MVYGSQSKWNIDQSLKTHKNSVGSNDFDCICRGVLVFSSSLVSLIIYGGITAATVYLLIAIGSINSRRKDPHITRPFRMPLFPLPPIIVILFLVIAITSQDTKSILTVGGFIGFALIYYFAYIRPKGGEGS